MTMRTMPDDDDVYTYDLTIQYTGKPGRGRLNATITVKTNEPTQSSIVIPVAGKI